MSEQTIPRYIIDAMLEDLRQKAKQSDTYKILTERKYHKVEGYPDWMDIMTTFAVAVEGCANSIKSFQKEQILMFVALIYNYIEKKSNTYWISSELYAIKMNFQKPEISEFTNILPHGLILFPTDSAPKNEENDSIDWLIFAHMQVGESLPIIKVNKKDVALLPTKNECIIWATQTKNTTIYVGIISKKIDFHVIKFKGKLVNEKDAYLCNQISKILVSTLVVQNDFPKEAVRQQIKHSQNKQHTIQEGDSQFLNPKWIGIDMKVYEHKAPVGTHNSPIPHTRKAHTRRQRYGKGRQEVKIIEIKSTQVNKNK
jgi:hypothetical protein